MSLLDHRQTDGLREVTLAGAGWSEKERVFMLRDESCGCELEDELPIHLLVEVEIEAIERAVHVAKRSLLESLVVQPILPSQQLVADERRQKVEMDEVLGLGLDQPSLKDIGLPESRSCLSVRASSMVFTDCLLGSSVR